MKKIIVLLLAVSVTVALRAQSNADQEPLITKSLSGESIKNVKVRTSGGSITVEGVEAAQARIEVYVRGNNSNDHPSKEELQKRLEEDYNLTLSVSNNQLTATAEPKDRQLNWKRTLSISFKVYTPRAIGTDLATSGGSIHLTNLSGALDFSTSGGSLTLKQVSGNVHGRTSGGSINVSESNDDIDLSTSGGGINANNCQGNLTLTTSGGSLHLDALKGKIRATTSGGSVNGTGISGELMAHTSGGHIDLSDLTASVDASTSGGHMHVAISEPGKYVTLSNSGGNIDLTLPANKGLNLKLSGNRIRTDKLSNFSGSIEEDTINGTINGGGIPVNVTAGSGRISLALK